MHSSLWLLLRLNAASRLRVFRRLTSTFKGQVVLGILVLLVMFWLAGLMLTSSGSDGLAPESFRAVFALGLAGMMLMFLLTGGGFAYKPAEVELLFPAPLSRRDLLMYKVVSLALSVIPSGLIFGVILNDHAPMLLGVVLGTWLGMVFLSIAQMIWGIFSGLVEQNTVARRKVVIVVGVLVAIGIALATGALVPEFSSTSLTAFTSSPVGRILLAPFAPFAGVAGAEGLGSLLANTGLSVLLLLGMGWLLFFLDARHAEAAVAASQRLGKQIDKAKKGQLFSSSNGKARRFSLPMVPRLGGAGPIAWHQLCGVLRGGKKMVFIALVVIGPMLLPALILSRGAPLETLWMFAPMALILLPMYIRCDFRNELDRMPLLKTLPISSKAICCGELVAPVVLLYVLELLVLGLCYFTGVVEWRLVVVAVLFCLPMNVLLFILENIIFLLFPVRLFQGMGDQGLSSMVRMILSMWLKLLVFGLVLGIAAGVGGLGYLLSGDLGLALGLGWLMAMVLCAALLPILAKTFERFDPSTDTPA